MDLPAPKASLFSLEPCWPSVQRSGPCGGIGLRLPYSYWAPPFSACYTAPASAVIVTKIVHSTVAGGSGNDKGTIALKKMGGQSFVWVTSLIFTPRCKWLILVNEWLTVNIQHGTQHTLTINALTVKHLDSVLRSTMFMGESNGQRPRNATP
jgi:hypothetical protein